MKIDKYFMKLAGFCWLLLALYACENRDRSGEDTVNVVLGKMVEENQIIPLSELSYTICLFRATVAGGKLADADYKCVQIMTEQSKTQADEYSFKISNQDIGCYEYQLFIHATPVNRAGVAETKVLGIKLDSSFDAIEIGMVKMKDGTYMPLSKDNYYASAKLVTEQMEDGIMTLKLPLKRLVGQLVFDFFKSGSDGIPLDVGKEYLSTFDRVKQIDMQVQGMTTQIKLADMVAQSKDEEGSINQQIITKLESDYRLNVSAQNKEQIAEVEKKISESSVVKPLGGTRVFSSYLLPTGKDGKELLKAQLTFLYYDTPAFDEKLPTTKQLTLLLPSTQKGVLKVLENCYTVTNIRLKNNRVIDLDASGGVDIDTEWD